MCSIYTSITLIANNLTRIHSLPLNHRDVLHVDIISHDIVLRWNTNTYRTVSSTGIHNSTTVKGINRSAFIIVNINTWMELLIGAICNAFTIQIVTCLRIRQICTTAEHLFDIFLENFFYRRTGGRRIKIRAIAKTTSRMELNIHIKARCLLLVRNICNDEGFFCYCGRNSRIFV